MLRVGDQLPFLYVELCPGDGSNSWRLLDGSWRVLHPLEDLAAFRPELGKSVLRCPLLEVPAVEYVAEGNPEIELIVSENMLV